MQYRRFTCSVRTNHTERLPFTNLQVKVMKDFHLPVTRVKTFNFQKRITLDKSGYFFFANCFCNFLSLSIDVLNGNDVFNFPIMIAK